MFSTIANTMLLLSAASAALVSCSHLLTSMQEFFSTFSVSFLTVLKRYIILIKIFKIIKWIVIVEMANKSGENQLGPNFISDF